VASGGTRSFLQRDSKQLSPCDDFAAVLWVGKCISQFSHLSATLSLLLGLSETRVHGSVVERKVVKERDRGGCDVGDGDGSG
jgi:hypothetical protein